MDVYGWGGADEFDLEVINGLKKGYFDFAAVREQASKIHRSVSASVSDASFTEAWGVYHDSFDDNEGDVVQALFDSFIKNAEHISPMNLNGTVGLFKDLGYPEKAQQLVSHYIASHKDHPSVFDLEEYPFADSINDLTSFNPLIKNTGRCLTRVTLCPY